MDYDYSPIKLVESDPDSAANHLRGVLIHQNAMALAGALSNKKRGASAKLHGKAMQKRAEELFAHNRGNALELLRAFEYLSGVCPEAMDIVVCAALKADTGLAFPPELDPGETLRRAARRMADLEEENAGLRRDQARGHWRIT
jgi:hypothetical protein